MPESRYRITERIAAGGMAEVFKGIAESLQGFRKNVAIKRILPNLTKNQKFVTMFLDEARPISSRFSTSATPTTPTSSSWSSSKGSTSRRSSNGGAASASV
jgi:serine/threonine protein kinase